VKWAPIPAPGLPDLVLLDGDCVLCSRLARAIAARDSQGRYRLVAIQSEAGRVLAQRFGVNVSEPETYAVVLAGVAYFKSDAALVLARTLPGWSAGLIARAAPRPLRDAVYDLIARKRYRWFGRREACLAPTAALRARMLERVAELHA
jgi:predicted DCC family thiol-disulfide oxidoreductase YuxK